jgi:N-acetyl-alpha-D-glucosaminyl L-malate synthase BshA
LPITKYALEQSDGVTAISNYLKQATIEHFGFDRIEVIPNFVCPEECKPKIDCDLRESLSPDGSPVLVHVSNFRPVKRPVDCVEILARVLKQTKARLVMVGDGSERTNCIHRARCLGVSDNCLFVGKQPNIVDYLCASDVLLLPSEQESFGLAALEAMAVQVPVIASRVGGLPEVIDDGETGYLSAVGDVDKMADDAAGLLMDPKLRKEMARRARAATSANTHKIIPQYISFEADTGGKITVWRRCTGSATLMRGKSPTPGSLFFKGSRARDTVIDR